MLSRPFENTAWGAVSAWRPNASPDVTRSLAVVLTQCHKLLMEKRLFLAALLSLAVLLAWELLVPKPPPPPPAKTAAVPTAPATAAQAPATADKSGAEAASAALPPPVAASAEETVSLENGLVRATISNRGGVVSSWVLLRHTDEQNKPLELIRKAPGPAPRTLDLEIPGRPELTERVARALFSVEKEGERVLHLKYADSQIAVDKEIRLEAGYVFHVKVSVVGAPYLLMVGTGLRNPTEGEVSSRYVPPATAVARSGNSFARVRADKLDKPALWPLVEGGFAGLEDNYFLAVFIPKKPTTAEAEAVAFKDSAGKPAPLIAAGLAGSGELDASAYFGPKDVSTLESVHAGLEGTVDFGWFGILARPLLWLLKRTYTWCGNYGVAILLVTLLLRIVLFPLLWKSYASMKKMQKLAPKMNAIRDKYKKARSDASQRQKMNEELMKLYQAEGYNPMSGCFPMLLQLPILIAFYNVLSRAFELRHAPFVLWIKDLSAVDHTYVLLILMVVSMYVQQAMTPTTADPAQKRIFQFMPLLWGFFLKDMPSGLVLYWLFSNILTIVQQMLINRMGADNETKPEKPPRMKAARA
jgi:YidC/Oxa1 family membrane protein insertase